MPVVGIVRKRDKRSVILMGKIDYAELERRFEKCEHRINELEQRVLHLEKVIDGYACLNIKR